MSTVRRLIVTPFERLRALRREIEYHSARRARDRWSRLSDLWLFASLPVAIVAVAVTGLLVTRQESRTLAIGILEQDSQGRIVAVLATPGSSVPGAGRFIAAIEVAQDRRSASWPVALWNEVDEATLRVNDGATFGTRTIPIRSSSIEADAVRRALARRDPELLAAAGADAGRSINALSCVAAVAVAWVVLLPLGFLLIQGLRARGAIVLRRRERRRVQHQRSLRCPGCGYDLRGSVFGERCPECGTMLT